MKLRKKLFFLLVMILPVLALTFSVSAKEEVSTKNFGVITDEAYYWKTFSADTFSDSLNRFKANSSQNEIDSTSLSTAGKEIETQTEMLTEEQDAYVDNQILVKYKESVNDKSLSETEQKEDIEVAITDEVEACDESVVDVTVSPEGEFAAVEIEGGDDVESVIEALESSDLVEYAEPMVEYYATDVAWDDPYYLGNWQWGYNAVECADLWNDATVQKNLSDIVIAVVDGGVDRNHEDLSASVISGYDFVKNAEDTGIYGSGHGTHVAGIAAGIGGNGNGIVGVASGASIMPIRVLNDTGEGTLIDVLNGILYAANHGADIINLSLGSEIESRAMQEAIDYAIKKGVLVVAASGNDYDKDAVDYPAACDGVLAVSAVQYDGQEYREVSFANNDADLSERLIYAPGLDIYSTYGGNSYTFLSGTSMATPFVSGMAALFKAKNPDLDGRDLLTALMDASYQQTYLYYDEDGRKQEKTDRTMAILDADGNKDADVYFKRFVLEDSSSLGNTSASVKIMAENKIGETDATVTTEGTLSYYKAVYDSDQGYVIAVGETVHQASFQMDKGLGVATLDLSRYTEGDVIVLQADESGGLYSSSKRAEVVGSYAQQKFRIALPDGYTEVPDKIIIDAYRGSNGAYYDYGEITCTYNESEKAFFATATLPYGNYVFEYTISDGLTNKDMDCYVFNDYIGCEVKDDNTTVKTPAKLYSENPTLIDATIAVPAGYLKDKTVFDVAKTLSLGGKESSLLYSDYGEAKWFKIDTTSRECTGYSLEYVSYSTDPQNQDSELLYWELYRKDGDQLVRVDDSKILTTRKYVQRTMYELFAWTTEDVPEGEYYLRIKGYNDSTLVSELRLVEAPVANVTMNLPAQSNIGIVAVNDKGGGFICEVPNTTGEAQSASVSIPIPTGDTVKLEYIDQDHDYNRSYSMYGCYTGSGMSSIPSNAKNLAVSALPDTISMSAIDKDDIEDDFSGTDTAISLNVLQKGALDYFEDEDWFSLTITEAAVYGFRVKCNIYCILDVYQQTEAGDQFLYTMVNDDSSAQGSGSVYLKPGQYRIRIANYGLYMPTVLADGSYYFIVDSGDGVVVDPVTDPDPEPTAVAFDDVPTSYWAYGDINALASVGVLFGRSTNHYVPEGVITRAEFLAILYRLSGETSLPDGKTPFADVDDNKWYAPYVAWGYENAIVKGISPVSFAPNKNIKRQDMAVMVAQYGEKMGISFADIEGVSVFPDDDRISEYAKDSVYVMKASGILFGRDTGVFDPNGTANRAEAAAIANRLRCYVPADTGNLTAKISNSGTVKKSPFTLTVAGTVSENNKSEKVRVEFIDEKGNVAAVKEANIVEHAFSFTVEQIPTGTYDVRITAGDESKSVAYATVDKSTEALEELLLSFPSSKEEADAISDDALNDLKTDIDRANALIDQLIVDGVALEDIKGDVNDSSTVIGGMENYLGLGFAMQRIDRFWWEISYLFHSLRDEDQGGGQYADVDFDMGTKAITIHIQKDELIGEIFDGHHLGEFNVIYDKPALFTPSKLEIANIRIMPYTVLNDVGMGILSVSGKRNILYSFAKAAGKTDITQLYLSDLSGTDFEAETANGNAYTIQFTGDEVTIGMLGREISQYAELPEGLYTDTSLKKLEQAVTNAKEVVAKTDASQNVISNAYTKILKAKNNLVNKKAIDKAVLEDLIAQAGLIKKATMPQAFYQYMLDAKADAAAVLNNGTGEEIRQAYNDLFTAIAEGNKGQAKLTAYQSLILSLPANSSQAVAIGDYNALKKLYDKVVDAETKLRCYGILQQDIDEINFATGGRVDITYERLDEMEKATGVLEEAKFVLIPNYRYNYDIPSDAAVIPSMDLATNTLTVTVKDSDTLLADILNGGRLSIYQKETKVAARYPSVIVVDNKRIMVSASTVIKPNAEVRAAIAALVGKKDFSQVTLGDMIGKTAIGMSFTEDGKTLDYTIVFK